MGGVFDGKVLRANAVCMGRAIPTITICAWRGLGNAREFLVALSIVLTGHLPKRVLRFVWLDR